MIGRIKKRDGTLQKFDPSKISKAMLMAFHDEQPESVPDVRPLVDKVLLLMDDVDIIEIEKVQDAVESILARDHPQIGISYAHYRQKRDDARDQRSELHPDSMSVAEYIHAAKYARYNSEQGRRELYEETVTRVMDMHLLKYPEHEHRIRQSFEFVYKRMVLPSMRSMQFAGRSITEHNARIYNCTFTLMDRPRAFAESFYLLLCGCGVGYSVQFQHVANLPPVKRLDKSLVLHHKVADTVVGWACACDALISAAFNGAWVEFDYSSIRPENAPLKTSGGKAPGHLPLRKALEIIRELLLGAQGRKLKTSEVHDIICFLAESVLAGGIRRSSLISLFSHDDGEMMIAKAPGQFEHGGLNAQRAMANNSVVLKRAEVTQFQFDRLMQLNREGFGEPGFFFTNYRDYGCNPCGEIGLNPTVKASDIHSLRNDDLLSSTAATMALGQMQERRGGRTATGFSFCNLCEVNVAKCESHDDLLAATNAAAYIGTLQAGYTDFNYLGPVTEAIARREALLGVGLTGMTDRPELAFNPKSLREAAYQAVRTNRETADAIGIRRAARVTTIKPSGTASLELGCVGSGCHDHHSRRYFRRITANPLESVARYFKEHNPHMVETKPNGDWCITFPVEAPDGASTVKDMAAAKFLERIFTIYENWIVPGTALPDSSPGLTHNVSATVAVRDDEWDEVFATIWKNKDKIAAMSFLPMMSDKGIPFMPREAVTDDPKDEAMWRYLLENYSPVDYRELKESQDTTDPGQEPACSGDRCEIQ